MPKERDTAETEDGCSSSAAPPDTINRHNLTVESWFSVFNGIFMGMILFSAPVILKNSLGGSIGLLTLMTCSFPCGAFLGPIWAGLGRRWGMKNLVVQMAVWANVPLFLMFWVDDAVTFTILISISQLLHSAMRMGQSSMYRATYPRGQLGRVIGRFMFITFFAMVATVLFAGGLADRDLAGLSFFAPLTPLRDWLETLGYAPVRVFQLLFPLAGVAGLFGAMFYAQIQLPPRTRPPERISMRKGIRNMHRVVVTDRAYMLFQLAFFLGGASAFMSLHVTLNFTHDLLEFGAAELAIWLAVVPQVLLALTSPVWGHILDRIGIVRSRWVISAIMTVYLACYFGGIMLGLPFGTWLICLGSILRGVAEGGGQITWSMASVHFAPSSDDVPVYNGIHFILNGIRGLVMPWVGTALAAVVGPWTIFVAMLVSASSLLVLGNSIVNVPADTTTKEMDATATVEEEEAAVAEVG